MKKKFLSLLMATCMVTMVLTGCGQKESTGDDVKASVEESQEDSKEEAKEESEEESKEEVVESSEEVVEASEEVEETEEVVESTEEAEEEETEVAVDSDIAKMYEGYLEKDDILPENVCLNSTAIQMDTVMDVIVAKANDIAMMSYVFPEAELDIYIEKEKVYWRYEIQGEEAWAWAPITSDEESEELADMSDSALVDLENIASYAYRETVEEDGVVFDLIDAVIDDGESTGSATFFVNRDTQKVERFVVEQDGTELVCLVEEIDAIEIPAEFENATEGTVEDVAMSVFVVALAGSGMMTE